MSERLLTIPQAAAHLQLSRPTIYRLIAEGKLPSCKIGKSRRIPESGLDNVIAQGLADAAQALVARTCAAQGIPETVTDRVILDRVATVIANGSASSRRRNAA